MRSEREPHILLSAGNGFPALRYLEALQAAGGQGTVRYLPRPDRAYDGLILTGGGDMDPVLFGETDHGSRDIDRDRDRAELALLDAFAGTGRPVLAICRGMQVVNVWLGGGLIQDLGPDLVPLHQRAGRDLTHPVHGETGTLLQRLYGSEFVVNSSHHQAVGRLGGGLRVSAWSPDGVIEGLEHRSLPLICVQFHPERMSGAETGTVDGGKIFRAFVELALSILEC